MKIDGCMLHRTDDWKTPKLLYDTFMKLGFVDCFPFQSEENEFEKIYHHKYLFVNPPYSKLKEVAKWTKKNNIKTEM